MITYNHEAFIAQAIEGVLMQETDFPFELVIGEDCSTDNTRKICEDYAKRFPDKIRLLAREHNLGMCGNFVETILACRGDFIAFCDGDDYWIDPKKLQIQADLLSKNPDVALCAHACRLLKNDGVSKDSPLKDSIIDSDELVEKIREIGHPHTSGWMFRRGALPANLAKVKDYVYDVPLLIILGCKGKILTTNKVMSVYRINCTSWTQRRDSQQKLNHAVESVLRCRDCLFPIAYIQFSIFLAYGFADLAFMAFANKSVEDFRENYKRAVVLRKFLPFRTRVALTIRKLILRPEPLRALFINIRKILGRI